LLTFGTASYAELQHEREACVNHSPAPPIAVDLFLTGLFILVCRWIKRNPSSFLRYVLFPFGGLNVERWPRAMREIMRVSAALGFFALLLTFVDLLFPASIANPTRALLYSKYAVCLVISFLALWGTAEPMEAFEIPQFGTPSGQPSIPTKAAPAVRRSVPPSAKEALKSRPGIADSLAAMPETAPAIAAVPMNAFSGSSVPPASFGQNRLSDAQAPPVPNRSYPLCAPPPGVVRERMVTIGSTFAKGAIFIGFFYLLGIRWLEIAFLIFFSLAILILFFGRNAPVGSCPFCGGLIQSYNRLTPEPVRCENCGEISRFADERFSPYDSRAVSEKPIFRSALFENGVWPNGCVQCGAPPTRFDEAKAVRYQYRRLATPLASVIMAPHPAARVTGVPYCERHWEALQVIPPKEMFAWTPWKYFPGYQERMEQRRRAFLLWCSLPMMRRYLEANRRANRAVSTGYREPNFLQKTVSEVFTTPRAPGTGGGVPPRNPDRSDG
jgi:hypothetical protein